MKSYEKHATLNFKLLKKLLLTTLSFNRLLHMKLPTDVGQHESQIFSPLPPRLWRIHGMLVFVIFITQKYHLHLHVGTTNNNMKYIKWEDISTGVYKQKGKTKVKQKRVIFKAPLVISFIATSHKRLCRPRNACLDSWAGMQYPVLSQKCNRRETNPHTVPLNSKLWAKESSKSKKLVQPAPVAARRKQWWVWWVQGYLQLAVF